MCRELTFDQKARAWSRSDDDVEICRAVADLARFAGYNAILSPSAAIAGERNLNLYIDGRADQLHLNEGTDRIALNY